MNIRATILLIYCFSFLSVSEGQNLSELAHSTAISTLTADTLTTRPPTEPENPKFLLKYSTWDKCTTCNFRHLMFYRDGTDDGNIPRFFVTHYKPFLTMDEVVKFLEETYGEMGAYMMSAASRKSRGGPKFTVYRLGEQLKVEVTTRKTEKPQPSVFDTKHSFSIVEGGGDGND